MNGTPRIGSLCSGYGGLDLAVMDAVPGAEIAWHAQHDPDDRHQWGARILAHRWPGVPNLGDITAIDYSTVEPVDVLTAGWPCQDMSLAGLGAGLMPGTRSGLWYHVARAIAALRPPIVFLENVRSLASARAHSDVELCPWCMGDLGDGPALRALGAVLGDLADLGFDAEWVCLPASGVGAPHERFRCFIAAWPASAVPDADHVGSHRGGARRAGWAEPAHGRDAVADPTRIGRREGWPESAWQSGRSGAVGGGGAATTEWGDYEPAIRRWESVTGRPAPMPTSPQGQLDPVFVEWMMGLPAGWVTAVPGIPRSAQLKALGNGVVRQQGAEAFRILSQRLAAP